MSTRDCDACGYSVGNRAADCPKCRTSKCCSQCNRVLPMGDFALAANRADGHQSTCKACGLVLRRTTQRNSDLKRKYGIVDSTYQSIFNDQGGVCAICGAAEPGRQTQWIRFHVDHDHETGEVRGILCASCNKGLGHFGDDPDRLISAARYLIEHRQEEY